MLPLFKERMKKLIFQNGGGKRSEESVPKCLKQLASEAKHIICPCLILENILETIHRIIRL